MILRFSVILLFESVYCSWIPWSSDTSSEQDEFSSLDLINNTSIIIGNFDNRKEVKFDQYLYSKDLDNLIYNLGWFSNNGDAPYGYDGRVLQSHEIGRGPKSNTPIYAVRISHDARLERTPLKPMFMIVGHDAVGYALLVSLMQYLVYSNRYDKRITEMLHNIDIWIVPTLNPDGLSRSKEGRCDETDGYSQNVSNSMIQFIKEKPFVLSGVLKGGAIVASYPSEYAEDEMLVKLAKDYATRNPMMARGKACNKTFPGGITTGMQEKNYNLSNCFEIELYLACCKYPKRADLPTYWHANSKSLLNFIESTRQGIYGFVKDEQQTNVSLKDAVISVEGKNKDMKVTVDGEYWRLLVPGEYNITATAFGYSIQTKTVKVTKHNPYVRVDFFLIRTGVRCQIKFLDDNYLKIEKVKITVPVLEDHQVFTNTYMVPVNEKYLIPLPLGYYILTAIAPGYTLNKETAIATEDNPQVQLVFQLDRPIVHVFVKNVRGEPLHKAVITLQTGTKWKDWKESEKLQLNEHGKCSIRFNAETQYFVTASQFGYTKETLPLYLSKEETSDELVFVLKKFLQIPCLT